MPGELVEKLMKSKKTRDDIQWQNTDLIDVNTKSFVYEIGIYKNGVQYMYIGYKTLRGDWQKYISSSKYVIKDYTYINYKKILKVFDSLNKGYEYESQLISQTNAVYDDKYYNRCNHGTDFNLVGLPKTEKQAKHNNSKKNIDHITKMANENISRNSRKCQGPDGTVYSSVSEAAKINNIVVGTLGKRCRSEICGWKYLEDQKLFIKKKRSTK
jgi:hypothetical protein